MVKRIIQACVTLAIDIFVLYNVLSGGSGNFNPIMLLIFLAIPTLTMLELFMVDSAQMWRKVIYIVLGGINIVLLFFVHTKKHLIREHIIFWILGSAVVLGICAALVFMGSKLSEEPKKSVPQVLLAIYAAKYFWYDKFLLKLSTENADNLIAVIKQQSDKVAMMLALVLIFVMFVVWIQYHDKSGFIMSICSGIVAIVISLIVYHFAKEYMMYSQNFYLSATVGSILYATILNIYEPSKEKG